MLSNIRSSALRHSLQHSALHCLCPTTISFAGTRTWRAAPATCGAIFDAARPADELAKIEAARLRSRLLEGPGQRAEAAAAPPPPRGGRAAARLAAGASSTTCTCWSNGPKPASLSPTTSVARSTSSPTQVDAGETKKMLGGEHDRKNAIVTIHPGRRRHRVAGLGRDAAAHVPALDRAPRLQARGDRPPAGRRGRASRARR